MINEKFLFQEFIIFKSGSKVYGFTIGYALYEVFGLQSFLLEQRKVFDKQKNEEKVYKSFINHFSEIFVWSLFFAVYFIIVSACCHCILKKTCFGQNLYSGQEFLTFRMDLPNRNTFMYKTYFVECVFTKRMIEGLHESDE